MRQALFILLLGCRLVQAQTLPVPKVSPLPTRPGLQELEATYTENLRKVQAPLMQQYLIELQKLLSTAAEQEAQAIRDEAAQVQRLLAEGGIVNLMPPKTPVDRTATSSPGITFTLEPHEASPVPTENSVVPIGEASWTLSRLPPGTYELIAQYSCPNLPQTAAKIEASYAGQRIFKEMRPSQLTKDKETFRVMRLGRFQVDTEKRREAVTIRSTGPGEAWLFIKQALLVKVGN